MLGFVRRLYYGAFFVGDVLARRILLIGGPLFALTVLLKARESGKPIDPVRAIIMLPILTVVFFFLIIFMLYFVVIFEDKALRRRYLAAKTKFDFDEIHKIIRPRF